jgi:hypothetical protein
MSFNERFSPEDETSSFAEENNGKEGEINEDFYEKSREQADKFLENFEFVNKEEIIDINPENPKDRTPVFFSPGWGVKTTSKSIIEGIANEDRRVISTFFTREEKIKEEGGKEGIPIAELQKALAIVETINKVGIDKVDAIGHSEGGLALAIAASLYPEKFRNIVFVAPAGMMKEDSYADLIKRFAIDEAIEEIKGFNLKDVDTYKNLYAYAKDIYSHVSKNTNLSRKEGRAMAKMDIFEMTKRLKEQGKVGIGLVCGVDDKVFPMEKVFKNINEDNVDFFVSTKGNHGSIMFNSEYISLAENLLENMSRKEK